MKHIAALVALLVVTLFVKADEAPDTTAGEKVYFLCLGCHGDSPQHRPTGPHLFDLLGRQAGVLEGFSYSNALSESGIFWDERTLDEFIDNPAQRVPGTMMAVGVSNAKDRADLIEYLKTLLQR